MYARFITTSPTSDITLPLNKLCRKGVKFEWTDECEKVCIN